MHTGEDTLTIVMDEAARKVISEHEQQEVLDAYQAGARGSLIIGLKGQERIITQLLPPVPTKDASEKQLERCTALLKRIRCDSYLEIRRAMLRGEDGDEKGQVLSIALIPCGRGETEG